jgi:hypothetical protein
MKARVNSAHVLAIIAIVLALGGSAMAVTVAKNSVGTKQLRKGAVTKAKIKKNAVVEAKIGGEAVTTRNLRNASVTGPKIEADSTLFPQIVRWSNGETVPISGGRHLVLPNISFQQNAEELITFASALGVHFGPKCAPPRSAEAFLVVDAPEPLALRDENMAAAGKIVDSGGGENWTQVALSPAPGYNKATLLQPTEDTPHVLSMVAEGKCATGDEVTGWGRFDVIGMKARVWGNAVGFGTTMPP